MLGHPIELGKPWNYVSLCHNAAAVLLPIYRASSYAKLLTELANRANSLARTLAPFGSVDMLADGASAAAWGAIRDVEPFAAGGALGAWPVWRIVCPPAASTR